MFSCIYGNLIGEKKTEDASHFLKYCEFVRDLNFDHGDSAWRFYDEYFPRMHDTHTVLCQVPVEELHG